MRENTKGFLVAVGAVNTLLSVADQKKTAGNVITVAESLMRERQSARNFEFS